jgi:hypothetical protein
MTASKDKEMHLIHVKNGDTLDQYQHAHSYSTMTYLPKGQTVLAADV